MITLLFCVMCVACIVYVCISRTGASNALVRINPKRLDYITCDRDTRAAWREYDPFI